MPSPGSLAEEERAVAALCAALTAAGRPAHPTGRQPDRDPEDPLTIDAVIDVNGVEHVVDVCSVTIDSRWPQAINRADLILTAALDQEAAAAGLVVDVTLVPQVGDPGQPWGTGYYEGIIQTARRLLPEGPGMEDEVIDDGTYVRIRTHPQTDDGRHVVLRPWLSASPDILEETTKNLAPPVEKKLNGQLANAKAAGYPVILLLDQVAPPDTGLWRNFMASPSTIAQAIAPLLAAQPGIVDEVWLRDAQGEIHSVSDWLSRLGLIG